MKFASLGSGSKGNSTLVEAAGTLVMIDCGFSMRETCKRLATLDREPTQIDAILVTHEHSDHCKGVSALSRKYDIPVYLTHGTHASGRCDGAFEFHRFNCHDAFTVGALEVSPIAVPHDAREPCQYHLSWNQLSLGILTDLGSITPHVVSSFSHCDALVMEFNHDLHMLQGGAYPYHLKRRVAGDWGHLNNHQGANLLEQVDHAGLREIVVAHISENNNTREKAEQALLSVLPSLERVTWAHQTTGFHWIDLS